MAKRKRPFQKSSAQKLESNRYDKIVKENLEKIIPVLHRKVIGV